MTRTEALAMIGSVWTVAVYMFGWALGFWAGTRRHPDDDGS